MELGGFAQNWIDFTEFVNKYEVFLYITTAFLTV